MLLLFSACIGCVGSLTTFRQRRLASPTSIPEIEATHPHVNVSPSRVTRARCVSSRPVKRRSFYSPRNAYPSPGRDRRRRLRRPPVREGAPQQARRRRARRCTQLPPVHAAALSSRELPPRSFGDHGA